MSDGVMGRWTQAQGGKRSHNLKRGKLGSFIPNHGGSNPTGFRRQKFGIDTDESHQSNDCSIF